MKLSTPGAFDGLRVHTDEINEVIARIAPGTLTIAVVCIALSTLPTGLILTVTRQVMDSMDWFDPEGTDATRQAKKFNQVLQMGGRVLLRSASIEPWYIKVFEENGFSARRVGARFPGSCIDRFVMLCS